MSEENPGPGRTPEEQAEPADVYMMGDEDTAVDEAPAPAPADEEVPAEDEPVE